MRKLFLDTQGNVVRVSMIAALLLAFFFAISAQPAQADTIFNVSATFADNNSTPVTGTVTINTATWVVDGFNFNIPTMTVGTSTVQGLIFTPLTATGELLNPLADSSCKPSDGSVLGFNIKGTPGGTETLQFLIAQTTLVGYAGSTIINSIPCPARTFFSVFGNVPSSSQFVTLSGTGTITAAPTPEPCSLFMLSTGLLGLVGAMRRKRLCSAKIQSRHRIARFEEQLGEVWIGISADFILPLLLCSSGPGCRPPENGVWREPLHPPPTRNSRASPPIPLVHPERVA
jgi:hypothetical protein